MIEIARVPAAAAPALAALHAEAFDPSWPAAEIAALIAAPGALALAATLQGDLAGFILCRIASDEAEVLTLATSAGLRRRGVASRLLAASETALREAGAGALFLEVAEDNPGALALYERLDFARVGRRPGYYSRADRPPAAAVIMRRDLNR